MVGYITIERFCLRADGMLTCHRHVANPLGPTGWFLKPFFFFYLSFPLVVKETADRSIFPNPIQS